MHAFVKGDAVPGVILAALEGAGTPNLLLQTDLTQVPTITISPVPLPPALLFEGSFGIAATQTITLSNDANTSVAFNVRAHCLCRVLGRVLSDSCQQMLRRACWAGQHHAEGRVWRLVGGRADGGHHSAGRGVRDQAHLRHQPERVPGRQHRRHPAHYHRAPACQGALQQHALSGSDAMTSAADV